MTTLGAGQAPPAATQLRAVRVATFRNATLAGCTTALVDFLRGTALASAASGTLDYPAGTERRLVWPPQFYYDGTQHCAWVTYTE